MAPGGPPLSEQQWAELGRTCFPELVHSRLRQSSWPAIEPHHDYIRDLLGEVTVSMVHQRLRDERGLPTGPARLTTQRPRRVRPEDRLCSVRRKALNGHESLLRASLP